MYRLKYELIALSIPIFVFMLYISINNFIQFPSILGQAAAPVNNINSIITSGNTLATQGNYNGAISLYDRVLAMDPNNIKALYNKGKALIKLGNYNGAISSYDKILSTNSSDTKAAKNKADVQAKLGKQQGVTTNIKLPTPSAGNNNAGGISSSSSVNTPGISVRSSSNSAAISTDEPVD